MPNLSPENIIIGLQNNLESLRSMQAQDARPASESPAANVTFKGFAGRTRQQDRRTGHRRKAKQAPPADAGNTTPQEGGE